MNSPTFPSLVETMGTGDPRVDRTRLHPLTDIRVLSVPAVICGADSFVAIALFGRLNEEWLRTFPGLPNGIPSHDTPGRVFARLDAARFEEGFRDRVQAAFERTGGLVVPVDGQCVRGSHDRGLEPLHPDRRLGRGQPAGAGPDRGGRQVQRNHGHPGTAAHALPGGCIVTLDRVSSGWGCRKKIARRIREPTACCVCRPTTRASTHAWRTPSPWNGPGASPGTSTTMRTRSERGHGGIEIRRCRTTGDPDLLAHADPDRSGATWPAWSGSSPSAAAGTGSRPGSAASFRPAAQGQAAIGGGAQAPGHRERPPPGPGRRLRRGRQPHPHRPRRPQHGHPERIAHNLLRQDRSLKVGIANKRLAAAWNKDCLGPLVGPGPNPSGCNRPGPRVGPLVAPRPDHL